MTAVDERGYLRNLKTTLVEALRRTFNATYPDERLRKLLVSIEYPVKAQDYPSIWVDFDSSAPLRTAGIAHQEMDEDDNAILRWRFEGDASYTIVAMSSLERDRIFDELVRVLAFSRAHDYLSPFRDFVETNDFIAMNMNFDEIEIHGTAAAPGTPWDTDEVIYEVTVSMHLIGEFVTDIGTGNLVRLSKIIIQGRVSPSTEENPDQPMDWTIPAAVPVSDWH